MQYLDAVVIGGGQAGLAMGYHLARRGRRFTILDAGPAVGHTWRTRWDSLRLLTPCPYNDLPGLRFPAPAWSFPSKDDVADYLQRYATHFALPVRGDSRVTHVHHEDGRFLVHATTGSFVAPVVVAATGPYQEPWIPALARGLGEPVVQLHSRDYRRPSQLPAGDVLVVGGGNSGAGIAEDLARAGRGHRVHLALGRTASSPRRVLGRDLFWWARRLGVHHIPADSALGRHMQRQPDGLIGTSPAQLAAAHGIVLRPRVVAAEGDHVGFADGGRQRFAAVLWATGFTPRYDWISGLASVLDERGAPRHRRGLAATPGLFFLGLRWQRHIDSSLLGGVGRDAAHLDAAIERHLTAPTSSRAWARFAPRTP
jgi:putative flavoprotein involved in K+ transport